MNKLFKLILLYSVLMVSTFVLCACGNKDNAHNTLMHQITERKKFIVGVKFDSKPFGYLDEKQRLRGFDIDLTREIAKRFLGSPDAVEFKQVTPSSRIFSLTSGSIDMIVATMTITPQRLQVVDFSDPYYYTGEVIMVSKGSKIRSMKDLNGKRVAIVLGSTSEKNIRMLAPQAILKGFRTYTSAYTALKSGRVEAMTSDESILRGFAMDDHSVVLLKKRYTEEPYGIAFRKDESSKSLQVAINSIIAEMKADGTITKLKRKWMKE